MLDLEVFADAADELSGLETMASERHDRRNFRDLLGRYHERRRHEAGPFARLLSSTVLRQESGGREMILTADERFNGQQLVLPRQPGLAPRVVGRKHTCLAPNSRFSPQWTRRMVETRA